MSDRPRSRRLAARIVLGALAVILLALGGIYLDAWLRAGRVIDKDQVAVATRVESLRNQRIMRPAFLEPEEEGNSWEPFIRGLNYFRNLPDADLEAFPSFQSVPHQEAKIDREAAEKLLAQAAPAIAELRSAMRRKWTEPSYAYEDHVKLMVPHISGGIRASRVLKDAGIHRHDTGAVSEAMDHLVLIWGIADRMTVKGPLVCHLVSIVCREMFLNGLQTILADYSLENRQLTVLQTLLEADRNDPSDLLSAHGVDDLTARMAAHSCDRQTLTLPKFLGSDEVVRPGWREGWSTRILIARFLGEQDHAMGEVNRLAGAQPTVRGDALGAFSDETLESGSTLYRLMFPQYRRAWLNQDVDAVRRSLARVALAVARFREDRGAFPNSLAELEPAYLKSLPRDEINQVPFGYFIRDGKACVYARGADGDDDGGRLESPDWPTDSWEAEDGDVVWTVKRK